MLGLARSTVVEVFGGCLEKFNLDPGACLVRRVSEWRVLRQRSACYYNQESHVENRTKKKTHTSLSLLLGHIILSLTLVASKQMYSRGKALVFSASLHHRVPSLYLFKIGQENPSRAFLRGQEKLEEKTGKVLNTKLLLIGFALYVMIGFCCWWWWWWCCCCFCCGWNMVRDVGAVFTWGTEACVAVVMRIFARQMGVLGLSGSWSGYARKIISSVQSLQKTLFFFFFFVFCFLGFWGLILVVYVQILKELLCRLQPCVHTVEEKHQLYKNTETLGPLEMGMLHRRVINAMNKVGVGPGMMVGSRKSETGFGMS
ncbi:hypothetical protein NC653_016977 [Populus alba x Populus x berolinensis]|uniref:Uncharacterized protein n=1 Tax=Populus alba x Populus x berolinensis TaxID=444605 RepID=A0AAD6VZY3_9ROSI|nr:hypothetical protein NC653_016977 [Populus alba x Populus x berolinensis]